MSPFFPSRWFPAPDRLSRGIGVEVKSLEGPLAGLLEGPPHIEFAYIRSRGPHIRSRPRGKASSSPAPRNQRRGRTPRAATPKGRCGGGPTWQWGNRRDCQQGVIKGALRRKRCRRRRARLCNRRRRQVGRLQCPRGCRQIPVGPMSAVRCLCFFDLMWLSEAYLLQTLQKYVQ